MASGTELLDLYGSILATSQQMLALAKAEEWDALVDKELERRQLVGNLRAALEGGPNPFDAAQRLRSEDLIKSILALDAETRSLAEGWMAELDQRLNSVSTSRRLQNTYLAP